jgi:hypothetical protein
MPFSMEISLIITADLLTNISINENVNKLVYILRIDENKSMGQIISEMPGQIISEKVGQMITEMDAPRKSHKTLP